MDLGGTVALVTGARRIGAVVAETLAEAGADIALAYRSSDAEAASTVGRVRARGRRGVAIQGDLADSSQATRVVQEAAAALGRLDVLVSMASLYERRVFDAIARADWDLQMHVELRSAMLCAMAAVPYMRRAGAGRIVLVTDWLAASGRPRYDGYLTYYVAKSGLEGLTRSLALQLASDGILVNAVAPGPILPPPELSRDQIARAAAATPLGRWGGAVEIAKAVRFLIDSDFVTGETIRVDGGRHLQ